MTLDALDDMLVMHIYVNRLLHSTLAITVAIF